MEEKRSFSEFAVASLVIGILSFVQLLAVEKAFCAIALGLLALSRITKRPEIGGKNLALAGVILGIGYILILSIIIGLNPGIFARIRATLASM